MFSVQIDQVTGEEWTRCLDDFQDANLYQTRAYGEARWGRDNLSHLVLKRLEEVVAMAQVVVIRPSLLKAGVAHLRWGPVCHRKRYILDREIVAKAAAALYDEYVRKRGLSLRVLPKAYVGTPRGDIFASSFQHYGSRAFGLAESSRTIDVDLAPDLDGIRSNLAQKWRNQLNAAERKGLSVVEDESDAWFPHFGQLLEQMEARKGFKASSDIEEFRRIQRALPPGQRMRVLMCERDGCTLAGLIGYAMGNTGVYLFGATTEPGMRCKAAYLLQWRMIRWLKDRGVTHYDLGGANPERNPGVYHFKRGVGGTDSFYVQPLVACEKSTSKLLDAAARSGGARLRALLKGVVYGRG